jgi:hypothetical protein
LKILFRIGRGVPLVKSLQGTLCQLVKRVLMER